ncbi:hypothetical protein LXL04_035628 [Taraxacum kok-saghyz]
MVVTDSYGDKEYDEISGEKKKFGEKIGGRVAVVAPVEDADGRTSRGNRSTQRGRRANRRGGHRWLQCPVNNGGKKKVSHTISSDKLVFSFLCLVKNQTQNISTI